MAIKISLEQNPIKPTDYKKDGLLYCGSCHTPREFLFTDTDEGKSMIFPVMCRCRKEIADEEELRIKKAERELHISRLRADGGISGNYIKMTFANDDRHNAKYSDAFKNYAEHFGDYYKRGQGFIFQGDCGTGKTFYAVCIANALIDKEIPVLITNMSDLIEDMHESDIDDFYRWLNRFRLVIFDDFGSQRETEYTNERVYQIINKRYESGKPMIFTTNLKAASSDRIFDRIKERCFPVRFEGESRRNELKNNNWNDMRERLGL